MPKIYKVKDKSENYYIKKVNENISNVPFRGCIVGKSYLSGKTNLLTNLLLQKEFYYDDFEGDNIYIFSPTMDDKIKHIIKVKKIPEENLFSEFDNEMLLDIYKTLEDQTKEEIEDGEKPSQKLMIFDDLGFSNLFKKNLESITKVYSNGRHHLIRVIILVQKYTMLNNTIRENISNGFFFRCSNQQLELIERDHNVLKTRKEFYNMFKEATEKPHSFLVINYNSYNNLYLDSEFNPIKTSSYIEKN